MVLRTESKIIEYLIAVSKSSPIHFNIGINLDMGTSHYSAYYIDVYYMEKRKRRIYIPPKIIDTDDVDDIKTRLAPIISKYKKEEPHE